MRSLKPIHSGEKIAIAVPTRNRHSYLSVLIACIINQTYTNWTLVINDQSDIPVERDNTLKDLFTLVRKTGHDLRIIRTQNGWARHQDAMEAVPGGIELILRIDDDMLPEPTFLEKVLKPFRLFPDEPLAATGGLHPEPGLGPIDLDFALADPQWVPRFDKPDWRLQGYYYYNPPEILEAETLGGGAICYRRTAVEDAGGWAVAGYSDEAFREESDLCARLYEKGYKMMITTEALVWHLLAPGGGARKILKTDRGNLRVSDNSGARSDERIFEARLREIAENIGPASRELRRYKIGDLERNIYKPSELTTFTGRALAFVKRRIKRLRALYRYFRM